MQLYFPNVDGGVLKETKKQNKKQHRISSSTYGLGSRTVRLRSSLEMLLVRLSGFDLNDLLEKKFCVKKRREEKRTKQKPISDDERVGEEFPRPPKHVRRWRMSSTRNNTSTRFDMAVVTWNKAKLSVRLVNKKRFRNPLKKKTEGNQYKKKPTKTHKNPQKVVLLFPGKHNEHNTLKELLILANPITLGNTRWNPFKRIITRLK